MFKETSWAEEPALTPGFNSPLFKNTGSVQTFKEMFFLTRRFNQRVDFDTSSARSMEYMFYNAKAFDQDVSHFNTAKVTSFNNMFGAWSND